MPEAVILDLFWVAFHVLLSQMRSNLYKIFTTGCSLKDSYKLRQKTDFLAHSKFFIYALLHPMIYTPIFASNERSYKYT